MARSDGDQSAISSGLEPGDSVVTEGQQRLKPGVTVRRAHAAGCHG